MVIPSQTGDPVSLPGGVLFPGLTAGSHRLCVLVAPAFRLQPGAWPVARGRGRQRCHQTRASVPRGPARQRALSSPFLCSVSSKAGPLSPVSMCRLEALVSEEKVRTECRASGAQKPRHWQVVSGWSLRLLVAGRHRTVTEGWSLRAPGAQGSFGRGPGPSCDWN